MPNYAFIGDVHSQLAPLEKAADYCIANNLCPIFLGDLFDSRCESSDSVGVYHLVKYLQATEGAIVLNSNHQDKLRRFLSGGNVRLMPELQRSISEFEQSNVKAEDLLNWLNACPYGFCFRDSRGAEYRAAHAMFPSWVEVPDYRKVHLVRSPSAKAKELMLYGPKDRDTKKRVEWWRSESERTFVRVSGHYHEVHIDDRSLVLDGGCGGGAWCREPGYLPVYDVERQELVRFSVPEVTVNPLSVCA